MHWSQVYNPLGSVVASTLVAAVPVIVLLGCIASGRVRAHWAALIALATAFAVATGVVGMPARAAASATLLGAAYGLLPICWIVLNILFLYRLTSEHGAFARMKSSIASLSTDPAIQLVLIAFALGSFFEGTAGFGTPVAITGALLIGLGFSPLQASGLSLIANTAPVAFGAMGSPHIALQSVTGLDMMSLSRMIGRQLSIFSLIVPFWLIAAYGGWATVRRVWPVLLVAGVSFAVPQLLMSNLHGPTLVAVVSSVLCLSATAAFVRLTRGGREGERQVVAPGELRAWIPWVILCVFVFAWGLPASKTFLNHLYAPQIHVPWLDGVVSRMPPVVPKPQEEPAVFSFNILSATGTSILAAALAGGLFLGFSLRGMARAYGRTLMVVWPSLLTISAMMAIGYLTRYSGLDAILGLAFARTGVLYPLFGTMLGWLGVALTGSDTSSNVLFGSLQRITATQLGLSPILMSAANSSGGVMGKMIDVQSIVVASTATNATGEEGNILRFVFRHSIVLALLVGMLVLLQAYVPPFTAMVVR
ncbi:MAG TPA: L-lactate permease [Gemmatimonadaceae bacterium]